MAANEKAASLSKLLPITALYGSAAHGTQKLINIVGLTQSKTNGDYTDINYTGSNYDYNWELAYNKGYGYGWGNSVKTSTLRVKFKDLFNLLSGAHKEGEVADLTDDNLYEKNLVVPRPAKEEPEQKSFWQKIGLG